MNDPQVAGTVHWIDETRTYGQKGFRKRLVVLEQNKGRFVNYIPLEFTNDNCDRADELQIGQDVVVSYRLNGRKWQRDANSDVKYFVNLEATHITTADGSTGKAAPQGNRQEESPPGELTYSEEDIPF